MSYFKLGSLFKGIIVVATAGGTTTLVASSKQLNQFTGTLNQTVILPDATTISFSRRFDIFNRSTGIITVQSNGGTVLTTIPAGSQRYFLSTSNSSAPGVWAIGGVSGGGGAATVSNSDKLNLLAGLAGLNASTTNIEARALAFNPETVGGNYWLIKAPAINTSNYGCSATLNGFAYVMGGFNNSTVGQNTNTRFDDTNNYWLTKQAFATVSEASCAVNTNGGILKWGGDSNVVSTPSYQYTDSTDSWATKASLNAGRNSAAYGELDSGNAITSTGTSSVNTSVEVYVAASNVWLARAGITYSIGSGQKGNLYNRNYYAYGGNNGSNFVNNQTRYNEDLNSWTVTTILPDQLQNAKCSAANGFNILAGGTDNSNFVATVFQYSDVVNVFRTLPSLSSARLSWNHSTINGMNYVLGGGTYGPPVEISTVEQYVSSSYQYLGIVKTTTATPASILLSVLAAGLNANVPVQIRSDGMSWKNMQAGLDSALKFNETYAAKFTERGLLYATGGDNNSSVSNANEFYNEVANTWTSKQTTAGTLTGQAGFHVNGLGFLAGGTAISYGTPGSTSITAFSDLLNTFTTKSGVLSAARSLIGMGASLNGFGYAVSGILPGGVTMSSAVDKYNASTDSCSSATAITTLKVGAVTIGLLGRMYVITGSNTGSSGSATTDNQRYDDVLNTWVAVAAATAKSFGNGFALNGFGYTTAGTNGGATSASFKYDPAANSWSSVGNSSSLLDATGSRVGGFGYMYGGYNGSVQSNALVYSDATGVWTSITGLNTARQYIGGGDFTPGSAHQYEVRIGVPANYTGIGAFNWVARASLTTGNNNPFSAQLSGVSVCGGSNDAPNTYYYDLVADAWLKTAPMSNSALTGGSYFNLSDRIYVTTGDSGGGSFASIYYSHITKTWASAANANNNRNRIYGNGRTLNGFGYMMGGQSAGGAMLASIEQYNISANTWTTKSSGLSSSNESGLGNGNAIASGYIYRLGGQDTASGNFVGSNVQSYNDTNDTWTAKNSCPTGIAQMGVHNTAPDVITTGPAAAVESFPNFTSVAPVYEYRAIFDAFLVKATYPLASTFATGFDGVVSVGGVNLSGTQQTGVYRYNDSMKTAILGMALEVK